MELLNFPDLNATIQLRNERERIQETITHIDEGPSEIDLDGRFEGKLFLGNKAHSENYNNIDAKTVISLLSEDITVKSNYFISGVTHHHYKIEDYDYSDLAGILDEIVTLMIEGLKRGNVLIHCYAGISRSASCVLYFLLRIGKFDSLLEAYEYLIRCRSVVAPNIGFLIQVYLLYKSPEDSAYGSLIETFYDVCDS